MAKGAIVYAIALIVTSASLSIIQGVADAVGAGSPSLISIIEAVVGRTLVALAGTAYLLLPALALGLVWALTARAITWSAAR